MSLVGHAAVTAFSAPIVVIVQPSMAARIAMAIAGALVPLSLTFAYLTVDDAGAYASSTVVPLVFAAIIAVIGLAGVVAIVRGTATASLYVANRSSDALSWSHRPARRLATTLDGHRIEVEIGTTAEREADFYVDGALLEKVTLQ